MSVATYASDDYVAEVLRRVKEVKEKAEKHLKERPAAPQKPHALTVKAPSGNSR